MTFVPSSILIDTVILVTFQSHPDASEQVAFCPGETGICMGNLLCSLEGMNNFSLQSCTVFLLHLKQNPFA